MKKTLLSKNINICIDLDDTLYNEIDYVLSGYNDYIKNNHKNKIKFKLRKNEIFKNLSNHIDIFQKKNNLPLNEKLNVIKTIRLSKEKIFINKKVIKKILTLKKYFKKVCIYTNGRSVTQRNKIKRLGLDKLFDKIFISDEMKFKKPDLNYFLSIENYFNSQKIIFIGNNYKIDLKIPIKRDHKTIYIQNNQELRRRPIKNNKADLIYKNFKDINIYEIMKLFQ